MRAKRNVSITSDVFRVSSLQVDVPGSSDMADVVGSGSDDDRKGVRDLLARELIDGVELCSLIYLSVSLSLARSAPAQGLAGDANRLPIHQNNILRSL